MKGYRQTVEELTRDHIRQMIAEHVQAGCGRKKAGVDSIEWDAESCMTPSQFLSRLNKRTDEYGGRLENRLPIVIEIYQETRKLLGKGYILGARINGDDLVLGGNHLLHSAKIAKSLAKEGLDYISVSCGQVGQHPASKAGRAAFRLRGVLGTALLAEGLGSGGIQRLSFRSTPEGPAEGGVFNAGDHGRKNLHARFRRGNSAGGKSRPDRAGKAPPVRP
jgi:2,4-dienoyl-CoA reductase-like NADH-dependent reductase (Old Yellow Enzyme family)